MIGEFLPVFGEGGEIGAVAADAQFVEDFAEGIEVALGFAGAFGREIACGANERHGGIEAGDKADIRQLRCAVDENDVRRFNVAMDEAVGMEMVERGGDADLEAIRSWTSHR